MELMITKNCRKSFRGVNILSNNDNKENGYKIFNHIIETLVLLSIIVFIGFVIWRLTGTMNYSNTTLDAVNNSSANDQINLIMTATDNAINKIYNILVVSTIFFTILVAAISIFQFIKIRDVDNLKREIISQTEKYQEEMKKRIEENNAKFLEIQNEYSNKFNKLQDNYQSRVDSINTVVKELDEKSIELDKTSALLKMEIYKIKMQDIIKKNYEYSFDMIMESQEIIEIGEKHQGYIESERLVEVYINIAKMYISAGKGDNYLTYIEQFKIIQENLNKALKLCKHDDNLFQIYFNLAESERIFTGDIKKEIQYRINANKVSCSLDNIVKLIISLDKRNQGNDLDKAMEYIRMSTKVFSKDAIDRLNIMQTMGYLENLKKSKYSKELQIED